MEQVQLRHEGNPRVFKTGRDSAQQYLDRGWVIVGEEPPVEVVDGDEFAGFEDGTPEDVGDTPTGDADLTDQLAEEV